MDVQLSEELRGPIEATVQNGHFSSVNAAMAAAARLLIQQHAERVPDSPSANLGPNPFLGSMREAADELDAIVADAYRQRDAEVWSESPGE